LLIKLQDLIQIISNLINIFT